MKIENHECYVSLEVAKLLNKAGFDWECKTIHFWYVEDNYKWNVQDNDKKARSILKLDYCLLAPTLDVAQRWLRVVKGIHLYVRPILDAHKYLVTVVVDHSTRGQVNDNNGTSKRFNTYEEAQEAGIKKVLEIVLEKRK